MNWEKVIEALVPLPDDCRAKAVQLRAAYPLIDPHALAGKAVAQVKRFVALEGAVAGAPGNPLAMVPLAAMDLVVVLKQEAKLAAVIAALLEPAVLDDPDAFRADILAIVFPNAVSQALREVASQAGRAGTRVLIRKYLSKGALRSVVQLAAKYLGIKVTQRAIVTKSMPIVSSAIGAAWNWTEVKLLGRRAIRYYRDQAEMPAQPEAAV